MDCIAHRVAKSWTQLSDFDFTSLIQMSCVYTHTHTHTHTHIYILVIKKQLQVSKTANVFNYCELEIHN